MRSVSNERAAPAVRAWLTSCTVDGGPTGEQLTVIEALATGYFGLDFDPAALEPLPPDQVADAFGDHDEKHRLVETMIVLELTRHPASAAQASLVGRYADALGVDEQLQAVARDYVAGDRAHLATDFARFGSAPPPEARLDGAGDDEIASDLLALGDLPEGTLGRGFFDFQQRNGFPVPTSEHVSLVAHDMGHVLAGYEANPVDEVALQAMLASATDGEKHFSSLVASLSLFEIGMLPFDGIEPKVGVMARPGAAAAFADAVRRGAACTADFGYMDHWAVIDRPLVDLQREMNIVPRLA
jgi:hypothetical protein